MSIYQDTHGIYHVYHDISNFLRLILMLLYMNGISPLNLQCRAMSSKCTHDLEFLVGYATGVKSILPVHRADCGEAGRCCERSPAQACSRA